MIDRVPGARLSSGSRSPTRSRRPAATTASAPRPWRRPTAETIVYLRRRFVPPPDRFDAAASSTPWSRGDRLDNIAAQYLGDPEQFWRICDANHAMRPDELTETLGRRLRITLPRGHSGSRGDHA